MVNLKKLYELQEKIAKKVILVDEFEKPIKTIAGIYSVHADNKIFVSIVVCKGKDFEVTEKLSLIEKEKFPYITGLRSFGEGKTIIKAYKKLEEEPSVSILNACGINHPRYCGLATYVGVKLNIPTIGVTRNLLCGSYKKPEKVLEANPLVSKKRVIGYALKSKKGCNPIFVSPGHKVSLKSSLEIVKKSLKEFKIPEPLRLALTYSRQSQNLK
jgi:deoxyribonuclease V